MKLKFVSASQLAKLGVCETALRFDLRGSTPPESRTELRTLADEGTRRHELRHADLMGASHPPAAPASAARPALTRRLVIVALLAGAVYYWGF